MSEKTRTRAAINVVLVEPEIPPNTGNVARLCAATNTPLHLVHPLGFKTDDKSLKRAGLDYWKWVEIHHHPNIDSFLLSLSQEDNIILFTKKAEKIYTQAPYSAGCYLLFGKETQGLPQPLLDNYSDRCYKLPIWGNVRSLNLATAVGIAVYEAYRQILRW